MTDLLIVEDSKADQIFIKRAVEALGNDITYVVANDGQEALEHLQSGGRPKVVVTDLKMPRLDGRQLVQAIKSNAATRMIPTLVFSTSTAQEDVDSCYASHANAYVVKPSSPKDYAAFARRLYDFWLEQAALPKTA